MSSSIMLLLATLMPVMVSALLYLANKTTAFSRLNYWWKQSVLGLIFGGVAIFGTEFGINVLGVTMNVRDAAPICAGLIFGAPAGIISGVIGGVERFIAAAWGAGEYTKIACSISTIFAGVFAAWLRKYMFDDKKPAWYYGLAAGVVAEVLHMLMVFLTNMGDTKNAFTIVQKCAPTMISLNGLSVMLATLTISLLGKEKFRRPKEQTKISQTFQRWLLICVLIAFGLASSFTAVLQAGVSQNEAENLLRLNITDVKDDIADASDANLLAITHIVAGDINETNAIDQQTLNDLCVKYDVAEINVIDEQGIITASTYPDFLNYDMASGQQSAEFLVLLNGRTKEFVQSYQPTSFDSNILRKYAGVVLDDGGFIQVAYDAEHFQQDISEQVARAAKNRHVGESGFVIICDQGFRIVSDRLNHEGIKLDATGIYIDVLSLTPGQRFEAFVYGNKSFCMYDTSEGYYIIAVLPKSEALFSRDLSVYITIFMEVLVFTLLFVWVYFLIKRLIVDNIRKVNYSLSLITGGNLNTQVDVRSNEEFASLSDDINTTVVTLRHYIDEAAARIDKELEFAKTIQSSSLPRVFPPYPNRKEFDIWAGMHTAKEVGGDFYDFYMLGEDKLAFLVADVSGKGIPAAMFMMTAKTMLKSMAETGADVDEVFTSANEHLCENNDAGMFVTAWMGILNLRSGLVTFANAGHNPPLVRHGDGSFEYLKSRAGFVLAGMDGLKYRKNELQLQPGDAIYLYTDGVTEATNAEEQLYGEERLQNKLNSLDMLDMEGICRSVKEDVDAFVGEAPQFDDITMLALTYKKQMD